MSIEKQDQTIGDNVRRLRLQSGLTEEQLADMLRGRCGISTRASKIRYYEKGHYGINITMLFYIASVFDVPMEQVLVKPPDPQQKTTVTAESPSSVYYDAR